VERKLEEIKELEVELEKVDKVLSKIKENLLELINNNPKSYIEISIILKTIDCILKINKKVLRLLRNDSEKESLLKDLENLNSYIHIFLKDS